MSLEYEPSSEPLHIYVKGLFSSDAGGEQYRDRLHDGASAGGHGPLGPLLDRPGSGAHQVQPANPYLRPIDFCITQL